MEPETDVDEIVVTDKELFEQAVNDTPPEPAAEVASEATPEPQEAKADRVRDDKGRFAPKEAAPAEAPKVAAPQADAPKAEVHDHRVPLRELLDERERRQQMSAELAQLKAWQQQVLFQQQQAQRQQQAPQEPTTIFDNPDQYLAQRVVSPLQQWGQMGMMQIKDGLSREMANQQFTEKAVNDALADMQQIRQTPQGDFIYRQIMASGHPYGALVKWHQGVQQQREIGPDPKAWLQKQLEEKKKDPAFQAEILALIREQQKGSGRPSTVSLPPSLSSIPAAAGRLEGQGDLSDSSLYNFATR